LTAGTLALELLEVVVVVVTVVMIAAIGCCSRLPLRVVLEVVANHLKTVEQQLGVVVDVEDALVREGVALVVEALIVVLGCVVDVVLDLIDFGVHVDVVGFDVDVYGDGDDADVGVNVVDVERVDVAILASVAAFVKLECLHLTIAVVVDASSCACVVELVVVVDACEHVVECCSCKDERVVAEV